MTEKFRNITSSFCTFFYIIVAYSLRFLALVIFTGTVLKAPHWEDMQEI